MGARRSRAPRDPISPAEGPIFCCDADALIDLQSAGLLRKLRRLVRSGAVKVPEGVYRELQRKTDRLRKTLREWEGKYSLVVALDYKALELLPEIERRYGAPFRIGDKEYGGFWRSASGRKSVDGQVVALAQARGWIVISNDDSVHGACMLEGVVCRRWEEIGRVLLRRKEVQALRPGELQPRLL